MKNLLCLALLLGVSVIFSTCNKDEEEDLTVEVTGDYIGTYGSNPFGTLIRYEITVARVDNNQISIQPKSSNEFEEIEIEIERTNSTTLSSPTGSNQQLDKSVTFTIGNTTGIALSIEPFGAAHTFVGEKQ